MLVCYSRIIVNIKNIEVMVSNSDRKEYLMCRSNYAGLSIALEIFFEVEPTRITHYVSRSAELGIRWSWIMSTMSPSRRLYRLIRSMVALFPMVKIHNASHNHRPSIRSRCDRSGWNVVVGEHLDDRSRIRPQQEMEARVLCTTPASIVKVDGVSQQIKVQWRITCHLSQPRSPLQLCIESVVTRRPRQHSPDRNDVWTITWKRIDPERIWTRI